MTTENNSVTGHETARQLVNKIKSQKTMAGMELHAEVPFLEFDKYRSI